MTDALHAPAHLIEDVLDFELKIVFCGTALGKASLKAGAYYAHPRNMFWRTLDEFGFTKAGRPLRPEEYQRVLEFGIGLTDLCKTASGNDNDLPPDAFDVAALHRNMAHYRPRILAFTSNTAGRAFCGRKTALGWQPPLSNGTAVYVLPSTSPMAAGFWKQSCHHWGILAAAIHRR